jgi:ribonuclease HI
MGMLKLNVDGSFSEHERYGGAGMILRDDTRAVLLSACRQIPFCISPLEAELDACREGIAKARKWSDQPCVVKMDSAEAVRMIKTSDIDRSCFTHEVHGIRRLLQLDPRYLL